MSGNVSFFLIESLTFFFKLGREFFSEEEHLKSSNFHPKLAQVTDPETKISIDLTHIRLDRSQQTGIFRKIHYEIDIFVASVRALPFGPIPGRGGGRLSQINSESSSIIKTNKFYPTPLFCGIISKCDDRQ